MKQLLFFFLFCACILSVNAQYKEVKRFTTADGLPSNSVYNCMEDLQGFLWICTPAGIARFDGKHFRNYTTKEGIPDNEVLQAVREKNGRIWISSYRQEAAYFDSVQNQFINAKQDTMLRAFSGTGFSLLSPMPDGGVRYYSQGRSVIFNNKQRNIYYPPNPYSGFLAIREYPNHKQLGLCTRNEFDEKKNKLVRNYILLLQNGRIIDSALAYPGYANNVQTNNQGCFMAIMNGKKILYLHNFSLEPVQFETDTLHLRKPTLYYHISEKYVYANTNDGAVDVYDLKTFRFLFSFKGEFAINSLYEDRYGDFWVSTRNNGLLYYRKSLLQDLPVKSASTNHTLYSFCSKETPQHYYVGLNDNTVIEYNQGKNIVHVLDSIKNPGIVHYLTYVRNKVYAFSEHAGKLNFKHFFARPFDQNKVINYKCIRVLRNQDLLLCGQGRLDWLDTQTDSLHITSQNYILNTCAAFDKQLVYTGSTDGLRMVKNLKEIILPKNKDSILRERITDLCLSNDSTLWVATSQTGIYAYKQEQILWKINQEDGLIHNMINSIVVDSRNQIWIGTNAGLSKIQLKSNGQFTIQNITQLDGLASNDVNQFYEKHDTMYVVTSRGITLMPLSISLPAVSIPVVLQGISVNQQKYNLSNNYNLAYDQNQVSLQFSGVDITGHFKQLEYKLNEKDQWTLLDGNTLNLNLNSGSHEILFRSVDVNGNRGNKILQLNFMVATPFWKSALFWIISISLLQIGLAFLLYKRIKFRQKEKLIRDRSRIELASLEQQAFTSLLNPHFIFNALNGLQDYINKADRQITNRYLSKLSSLIRKSFELAQQSFVSFEEDWSNLKQYLELEQQRHQPSFQYQLHIDKNLDPDDTMLPSMLLQPLIENALLHGKLSADPQGMLVVRITSNTQGVTYQIQDNGVGFQQNKQHGHQRSRHTSRGLALLQKRLDALGELCGQPIHFQYSVPFPDREKPGHTVEFTLPHNLYGIWQKSQKKTTT